MIARIRDLERRYSRLFCNTLFAAVAEIVKDEEGDARKKVDVARMSKVLEHLRKWSQIG
ncbi:MAG TPA: hypothetical protein VE692_00875 [Nitrososphaera sp.]|nr:hypothetical protein [Nitrososphaera sp.]